MHTIRLRRPWERRDLASEKIDRVDVPDQATHPIPSESVTYARRFQCPDAVLQSPRVDVFVQRWTGQLIEARLNEERLAVQTETNQAGQTWPVTSLLRQSNELTLTLRGNPQANLDGEVELRIHDA